MSQLSVLIVEDEAILAAHLASKVKLLGYRVTGPVSTGEEALALAQAGAYMEESGASLAAYLELFKKRQRELLRRGAASDTAPTVATTASTIPMRL